ncbi:MAG: magnesium chelatase subunit H, partial [Hyphomicrobiaceae bacterium]
GFSLVGGPAYNDADAAEEILAKLDVPYLAAHAIEFQSLEQWRHSDRGLMPIEQTIMVAIPEIDGATAPTVFGGRSSCADRCGGCERACQVDRADGIHRMQACIERAEVLAARTARLVELRTTARAERKIGVVLFNFPPNAGATGTAAYLGVFESLFNVMHRLAREGYTVELPQSVDALRRAILEGNSEVFGADANVHIRLSADDHVRRERYLTDIERQWGPAPGRQQSDGQNILVLGKQFGNLLVAVQPGFGYEGDPMRLLFEGGFAPTHAFSAFYRYLREDFRAHALLHFGTHGALEFMPGKQSGSTSACWPERLIGDVPNVYLYAANNPSEGTIAKRRSAATLVSYLTPAVAQAGLYRGLLDLKSTLDRLRAQDPAHADERSQMLLLISEQARAVDLIGDDVDLTALDPAACDAAVALLGKQILELEYELIPHGLHVIGESMSRDVVSDLIQSIAEAGQGLSLSRAVVSDLLDGADRQKLAQRLGRDAGSADVTAIRSNLDTLADVAQKLKGDGELDGLVRALDARFIRPVAGGDILKSVDVLPTGRNVHGFDPFRMPTAFAVRDGRDQANRLISRHVAEGHGLPETVAIVLWGTDNLKSEGGPIAQALALLGAEPRFDSYGRLTGAKLIPLNELGRPRIDVVITLSGIFRDLLPLQTRMLAEAAYLAATADEPVSHNLVRAHALAYADRMGCDIEVAALRVFSNADGTYGANVNQLVDAGCWSDEDELADAYETRKSFAYGRDGKPVAQKDLLASVLATVDVAYQNLESVELGVTTIDHYFDTLGGIGRAVRRARGGRQASIYIGDQTRTGGKVRTLAEQVALETRTRMLNPKWTEGMLKHGYEGVRQIEAHVTNTIGWSATTGAVAPWVYQQISETYVLDEAMRRRLSQLNPKASAKVARRLLEAHERNYWNPDEQTLEALREAGDELDDRVEGLGLEEAAA